MSRRIGQKGNVYQPAHSGQWNGQARCYGRYWRDTPDGRVRRTVSLGVCRTETLARAKLRDYLEREGVNSATQFNQNTGPAIMFREQAEIWLAQMRVRKRKPVKPATLHGWRHSLDKWLLPLIGEITLSEVGNAVLKTVIEKMHEGNLSSQSIVTHTRVLKMVVTSALTAEGEQIYPRKWNHDFVGMPIIEHTKQRRPTLTASELETRLARLLPRERVLVALLAGTGLRRGEALALRIDDFSSDYQTVRIQRSVWNRKEQAPKTPNAVRSVDICCALAEVLRPYAVGKSGLVFATHTGKPLMFRNVARSLSNAGFEGFHSLRRFRTERLRSLQVPEDLIKLWLGHADKSVTDLYARGLANNETWRREWADKVGLGFSIGLHRVTKVVSI